MMAPITGDFGTLGRLVPFTEVTRVSRRSVVALCCCSASPRLQLKLLGDCCQGHGWWEIFLFNPRRISLQEAQRLWRGEGYKYPDVMRTPEWNFQTLICHQQGVCGEQWSQG